VLHEGIAVIRAAVTLFVPEVDQWRGFRDSFTAAFATLPRVGLQRCDAGLHRQEIDAVNHRCER
jgi:hypothetical protein